MGLRLRDGRHRASRNVAGSFRESNGDPRLDSRELRLRFDRSDDVDRTSLITAAMG
jgi:hypothetical protein